MNLIVETDIGHDPDDLFALCYLIAAGVNIQAILVHPGDPDQIAIAKYICEVSGIKPPIGFDKFNRTKNSSGSIHHQLLGKRMEHLGKWGIGDGYSEDILNEEIRQDTQFFICGPVTTIGNYLENFNIPISRATMQGGFISNDLHTSVRFKLNKFNGKLSMSTFNLNGDKKAGEKFLSANIKERRMVGKNLCHGVNFLRNYLIKINPRCEISKLFKKGAELYFAKHSDKKFHDPTAAVLHLHPEIGEWVRGKTIKMNDGWGTVLDPSGDYIATGIDEEKFWDYLFNFN